MKLVLSTGSLYTYGLDRVFALAAEAGFDGMEVLIDARWDGRQPDYLARLMQESGLPITTVHTPFIPWVPGWPPGGLDRLERSAEVARAVGAGVVVAHLPLRFYGLRIELLVRTFAGGPCPSPSQGAAPLVASCGKSCRPLRRPTG